MPAPTAPAPALSSWTLEGRLGLSNGEDAGSGSFVWAHSPDRDELAFRGAFGRGSWTLVAEPGLARLELADGRVSTAPAVSDLIFLETGWHLPVDDFARWVIGQSRSEAARVEVLREAGWTVEYQDWFGPESHYLPRRIRASRGEDEIKLLVRKWTVDPTS